MKVLVVGYYDSFNQGDELFKEAFIKILPEVSLTFTKSIQQHHIDTHDAIIFGGGSFLDGPVMCKNQDVLNDLSNKNIYYCGVGAETNIHPEHQALMRRAKGLFVRSSLIKAKQLNSNSWQIPDLVYSLSDGEVKDPRESTGKILYIPNGCLVPRWNDSSWKLTSWLQFKSEMAQSLEELSKEYRVSLLGMCSNEHINDINCGGEVLGAMRKQTCSIFDANELVESNPEQSRYQTLSGFLHQFDAIVTQRFHGVVLAQMTGVPYVSIDHHDKLKSLEPTGASINYYAFNKTILISSLHYTLGKSSAVKYGIHDFKNMKKFIIETMTYN